MFNGLTMWKFNLYGALYNVEASDSPKDQKAEQTYKDIDKELNELTDGEADSKDKVEIKNSALNNALKNYLMENPTKLGELRDRINGLTEQQKAAGWDWLRRLINFLGNRIDKEMKRDYDEFMKNLDTPNKLSNTNNNELKRIQIYLQSNEADALKAYEKMKKVNLNADKVNEKDRNVFNAVRNTLKDSYKDNDKFLKVDFEDLFGDNKLAPDTLGAYKDNWDGEDFTVDTLSANKYKEAETIISKETLKDKLNALNKDRIDGIHDEVMDNMNKDNEIFNWYKFQKIDGVLKISSDDGSTRTDCTADTIMSTFKDKIVAYISTKDNVVSETEASRLADKDTWKQDIYTNLFNSVPATVPDNTEHDTNPETKVCEERDMTSKDFDAMSDYLTDDKMFIIKGEWEDGNDTYSYDKAKLKSYLEESKNDETVDNFKLSKTMWAVNVGKRRAWISAVQILLNEKYPNNKIKVDWKIWKLQGWLVWETIDAVKTFQRENNLAEDGIPGPNTILSLLGEATVAEEPTEEQPTEEPTT